MLEPLPEGAVQDTVACPAPATAEAPVGALGKPEIVVLLDGLDVAGGAIPLLAATVKV